MASPRFPTTGKRRSNKRRPTSATFRKSAPRTPHSRLIRWGAMPDRSRKRPTDPNELARQLVDEATGEAPKYDPTEGKDPAAVALGRRGGLKGGKARAAKMTPEQRIASAKKAALARWAKKRSREPIRLSETELEAWGTTHRPPRSWYEQDEEDLS